MAHGQLCTLHEPYFSNRELTHSSWMVGPNWPNQGEIDIYEGVHLNTYNQATLHTSPGCVPSVGPGGETGRRVANADCGAGGGFDGCGVSSNNPTSYGTAFNANGGGVYAALWTNSGIKVWYFASRDVPANIRSGNPDPSSWGTPIANFGPGCDYGAKFRDLNIVFDITFCGDWAGGVWGQTSCAQVNPSCNAYVASQPQSFADVSAPRPPFGLFLFHGCSLADGHTELLVDQFGEGLQCVSVDL